MNFAPSGAHFFDTSAVILMMRLGASATPEAFIAFITYAELLTGIERARDPAREDQRMFNAIGANPLVYPDLTTLTIYGTISAQLQSAGQPLPTNDLWIAALALQWEVSLLSDDAHFHRVPGLKVFPVQ